MKVDFAKLVYIRYRDHLLFRNCDPKHCKPNVREVVGWMEKESEDALSLIYDRSVKPLPFEKRDSGLILLKSSILEMRELE